MSLALKLLCALAVAALLVVPASSRADDDDDDGPRAGAIAVSAVAADSATVSAPLQLDGGQARYRFVYRALGTWASTPFEQTTARRGTVTVSRTLTALKPATSYEVWLFAEAGDEDDWGAPASFTTAAQPARDESPAQPAPAKPPASAPTPVQPDPVPVPAGPETQPALGTSVVATVEHGTVRVRLPGSSRSVDLAAAASVPVGSIVDARRGAISLTTALPGGATQTGTFGGARFKVRQPAGARGRIDLHLRGGGFDACRARRVASAASGKRKPPRRRLWGKDRGGRFRTHGRDSVTTVRGTEWSVTDRCDGTLTRVSEGAVDVRVRRTGRVVRLGAGEHFLARHRR